MLHMRSYHIRFGRASVGALAGRGITIGECLLDNDEWAEPTLFRGCADGRMSRQPERTA